MTPDWYGERAPTLNELEAHALMFEIPVFHQRIPKPVLKRDLDGPICILVPDYDGVLAKAWAISHELGHLVLGHAVPRGPQFEHSPQDETEATRWAACALLPEKSVRSWPYPSVEVFLQELAKSFQPIPRSGGIRPLACVIAYSRLRAMGQTG